MSMLFMICIKNSYLRINFVLQYVLFASDSSFIISSRNVEDFHSVSNLVLSLMIKWFAANNLVLHEYNEIHNKEFITF